MNQIPAAHTTDALPTPPAIDARGLTHSFGSRRVLSNVDLQVRAGSIHGFVGPNGAGKTTTLNILATLLQPRHGRVHVLGIDLRREAKRVRRKVGYMPEHFSMYRQLTCFEYLDFFAAAHGQDFETRDARLEAVIATANLAEFVHRGIGTLSRGMQQRVCLARVLLHDPPVLLLDEPASGLDPRARAGLYDVVRHLADTGRTILMSSHILAELADACDDVTVLDRGHVRFSGSMRALLSRGGADRRGYRIDLARPTVDLLPRIATCTTVEHATLDGTCLHVEFTRDAAAAGLAGVLDALLGLGVPVCEVHEDQRGLDEVFLELTQPEAG